MIRDRIYKTDPYYGLDETKYNLDLQGWCEDPNRIARLVDEAKPTTAIEVGTWKGTSAVAIGERLASYGGERELICIDTFLGSLEHMRDNDMLAIENGMPQIYRQFLVNMKKKNIHHIVTPLVNTSRHSLKFLRELGVKAGFIYVDAGHEYEDVLEDLNLCLPLLENGGVFCGDDYSGAWPGVVRAVNQIADREGFWVTSEGCTWRLRK